MYLNGSSRTLRVGHQTVRLEHAPTERLYGAGTRAGMVVQALHYLGPEGVNARVVRRLRAQLDHSDKRILRRGAHQMPDRMRPVAEQITALD